MTIPGFWMTVLMLSMAGWNVADCPRYCSPPFVWVQQRTAVPRFSDADHCVDNTRDEPVDSARQANIR